MKFLQKLLRDFCLRTGRGQTLYRNFGQPDHRDWADFQRRHKGVDIGSNTTVNPGACFMDAGAITIGHSCSISDATFVTHSGYDRVLAYKYQLPLKGGINSITVGNYCGFGTGAKIIGPVAIGNDCYIAAGAIVTKDVPNGTMVVGFNNHIGRTENHARGRIDWDSIPEITRDAPLRARVRLLQPTR